MESPSEIVRPAYQPVYSEYFADPFIWEDGGEYFAIGTGPDEAAGSVESSGPVFPLIRSPDLRHWRAAGRALSSPEANLGSTFWAPEVAKSEGRFFLYYSVGHGDKQHQLRVAVADQPLGPYRDTGRSLVAPEACPFAIDPDPFRDSDGQWYLFYARDFLDCAGGCRAGTALVVDRLLDMTRLAGEERVVLRASHDWQRFQQDRLMYGRRWDWHTLEGPCVRKIQGRYYCFYSGGCWENESYGVDYAVADHVVGPYAAAGSEAGPRVLRSVPGQLAGPGHNSVVRDRDSGADFIVYQAWDPAMTARRMFIDPLVWTAQGPRIVPRSSPKSLEHSGI